MKAILELLSISKKLIDVKLENEGESIFHPIPKWISTALLLTDLYQKTTISDQRRKMLQEESKKVEWMWFDTNQVLYFLVD